MLLAVLLPTGAASAADDWQWSAVGPVAPGVEHEEIVTTNSSGPVSIDAVTVDVGTSEIGVETVAAHDAALSPLEAHMDMVARRTSPGHRVIAAINGGTYACRDLMCSPIGLNVIGGELFNYSAQADGTGRPAFGMTADRKPMIGVPTLDATVALADGTSVRMSKVNRHRMPGDTVLYTPRWGTSTRADDTGVEIVLEGVTQPIGVQTFHSAVVRTVRAGLADAPVETGTVVISASAETAGAFANVQPGDEVLLTLSIDEDWRGVSEAVGGREILVTGGEVHVAPTGLSSYDTLQPRSALGITADGRLLMVAVDGRQTHSVGVTVPELARLMVQLGAVEAVNVDGGNSTQLAARRAGTVDARLVNQPSSTERKIATTLQIVSTASPGEQTGIAIVPGSQRIRVADVVPLKVGAHDSYWNGLGEVTGELAWSVDGAAADVDAAGTLTGLEPGVATISVRAGQWSAHATVTVVERVAQIGPPSVAFIQGVRPSSTSSKLRVNWSLDSPDAPITKVELQRRLGSGSWQAITLPTGAPTSADVKFTFGRRYTLRVRAEDSTGYTTPWRYGDPFRLDALSGDAEGLTLSGAWRTVQIDGSIGGSVLRSRVLGESAVQTLRALPFAVVSQRGPRHGVAEVWVNGVLRETVKLRAEASRLRQVIYVGGADISAASATAVEIRNVSPGSRTIVDLDSILVISPAV